MFTLGSSFDTDPQYPWIAQHLRPSELEDTQTLACRLYAEFANYQESVAGVANKFALAALQRVVQWQGEELRPPVADLDRAMLTVMRKLYPEKAAYLGAESMAEITQRAAVEATGFGLSPTMGTAILGGMMVAFGSGVCSDPLYPWVSRTLTDPLLASPGARLERLFNKVKTYAANAAEYLAGSN